MTKRSQIADRLRERILKAIGAGAVSAGDRLPSSREFATEFRADPRVIAAAYRELALDGLVEVREKSGVYVAATFTDRDRSSVPEIWATEMLVDAIRHGITLPDLGPTIIELSEPRRIRAVVVAETTDQATGITRELKSVYGLAAPSHLLAEIRSARASTKLSSAHVVLVPDESAGEVRAFAAGRPVVSVFARPDLFRSETWLALGERELYLIATDQAFIGKVRQAIQRHKAPVKLRALLAGRDDLSSIPAGAPTYITESARSVIGKTRLPGRVIRPRSLFSDATVREIVSFIVAHNSTPDAGLGR